MDVKDLYSFVLMIVLVVMIVGVGVITLDKFGGTGGLTPTASTAINAGRDAIGALNSTWMSLVITIGILALILGLVVGGFAFQGGGR